MSKIVLILLVTVLTTVFAFPANPDVAEQEVLLTREIREANPEPHHHGFGGFGGYGGGYGGYGGHHGGYGGGYPYGGYGGGYPHGGGYGGYGGGSSQSSAHAGAISSPFGSASFASAKAG
ncbi:hypothetical protein ANTQUA_LOCUS6762 [Anthophora quadrimaculata]